jgi:putative hemolysin
MFAGVHDITITRKRRFEVEIAADAATITAAQALRYLVFAEEMGAVLHSPIHGLDIEELDSYCDHLVVRDCNTGAIVATTRLLSDQGAERAGRYYSESEFYLDNVLSMPGRFLEVGRTCIDSRYRGGAPLAMLWNGLAEYAVKGEFDFLMGCASISPSPRGFAVDALYHQIEPEQRGSATLGVVPRRPVPAYKRCRGEDSIPPLLKAYLRLGAWVCGEPCWDEDFDVMDVFILLPLKNMHARYEQHFIAPQSIHRPQHEIAVPALV